MEARKDEKKPPVVERVVEGFNNFIAHPVEATRRLMGRFASELLDASQAVVRADKAKSEPEDPNDQP